MNNDNNTGWSTTVPACGTFCWFSCWMEQEQRYSEPGMVLSYGDMFCMVETSEDLVSLEYYNGDECKYDPDPTRIFFPAVHSPVPSSLLSS